MKYLLKLALSIVVIAAFAVAPVSATEPGQSVNPNGFPSGEHYNLNIIGKNADFTCPGQEYLSGAPLYGNVIYVPQKGTDIKILLQSGAGNKAAAITTLQETDPCTAGFDGSPAVVQIPKNTMGYRVYARALAKPTDNPSMQIIPSLASVEDEYGNDLVYLGLVTSNGFETPLSTFTRQKGKSTAVNITGMFEWTGDVCYFNSTYCLTPEQCTTTALCCTIDANALYQNCTVKVGDLCPLGTVDTTAYCRSYSNEWVFNIGDFVTEVWGIDNNGLKLLQVRFYPVQ